MSIVDDVPAFSGDEHDMGSMFAVRTYAAAALTGIMSGVPISDNMARDPYAKTIIEDISKLCLMVGWEMVKAERESCTKR